jgi:predicted phosphodiesterase
VLTVAFAAFLATQFTSRTLPAPAMPLAAAASSRPTAAATPGTAAGSSGRVRFAVIGDFGSQDANEAAVARLVSSRRPDLIVTTGDNYYRRPGSLAEPYDASVGRYYCRWLAGITTSGLACRTGDATRNAFFPTLGNHDLSIRPNGLAKYSAYFDLPGAGFSSSSGNERFYDFVAGPVHFFMLDSNSSEPSGTTATSPQAQWLRGALAASTSSFNIVCLHHPTYSSDAVHGSTSRLRWPFAAWGADIVISGHAHVYERVKRDGIVYLVNGLGGASRYGFRRHPVSGSVKRFQARRGAVFASVTATQATFVFRDVSGHVQDRFVLAAH